MKEERKYALTQFNAWWKRASVGITKFPKRESALAFTMAQRAWLAAWFKRMQLTGPEPMNPQDEPTVKMLMDIIAPERPRYAPPGRVECPQCVGRGTLRKPVNSLTLSLICPGCKGTGSVYPSTLARFGKQAINALPGIGKGHTITRLPGQTAHEAIVAHMKQRYSGTRAGVKLADVRRLEAYNKASAKALKAMDRVVKTGKGYTQAKKAIDRAVAVGERALGLQPGTLAKLADGDIGKAVSTLSTGSLRTSSTHPNQSNVPKSDFGPDQNRSKRKYPFGPDANKAKRDAHAQKMPKVKHSLETA